MYYILEGRKLRPGRPFAINGFSYSYEWLTQQNEDTRASLGITIEEETVDYFDPFFYKSLNTPKDLAVLQELLVAKQKRICNSLLSPSDWYIIRNQEESTAIPANVTTYRQAVRAKCVERESAINDAADVAALEAVCRSLPSWPVFE